MNLTNRLLLILLLSATALTGACGKCGPGSDGHVKNHHADLPTGFQARGQSQPREHPSCSNEQVFYHNGRVTGKLIYWNNEPWERTLFEYLDEISRYSVQTMIYQEHKLSLVRKDLFESSDTRNRPDQKIETWYYYFDKNKTNALRQVDTYWPKSNLVKERQLFDESGGLKASALFEYEISGTEPAYDDNDLIPGVNRMTLMDDEGHLVLDYKESTHVDIEALYRSLSIPQDEIRRRVAISKDPRRTPILIMDGGLDISHPELAYKLWQNPHEAPTGRDDDGNGLVDDLFGISDNPRLSQPVYDLRLPRFGLPSFSHGTLVASVAVAGREDTAVMAASELTADNSSDIVTRTEQFIHAHHVRFTNMSYVFDRQLLGFDGRTERPLQIEALIAHTPETLHVVAAGNGTPLYGTGFNMDMLRKKKDLVPAMLANPNILVVGALDTAELNPEDYPGYQVANFSNVGETSVDILAPGTGMCGAQMGGGTVCKDGTSFAAPYVLNHGVLDVASANPELSIYAIKEIIIKSAYIPNLDKPLPVLSGGILHPGRAVAAARWLAAHPGSPVEEAVLAVRRAEQNPIPGESRDETYLAALKNFWSQRRIGQAENWKAEATSMGQLALHLETK